MMVVIVSVPRQSQYTPDAAFDSTHYSADRTPNHRADRTGCAVTDGGAVLGAVDNALGLGAE